MGFCECGCGGEARRGNRFVHGHNSRVCHPMLGRKHSWEARRKLRESHLGLTPWITGKHHSEESRKTMSQSHSGVPLSDKHRRSLGLASKKAWAAKSAEERLTWAKNISAGETGKYVSPETRKRISASKRGKHLSPQTEFTSALLLARYRDPVYVQKMAKAWNRKPNKPEALLINLLESMYPGQWKYTGDFSLTINGKCPDFVNINGQKKIIELFGDYWHRGQNPEERIAAFKPFGYEALIIWEHELKNMVRVIDRIHSFADTKGGA